MNEIKRFSTLVCYGACVASLMACKGGSNSVDETEVTTPPTPPTVVGADYKNIQEGELKNEPLKLASREELEISLKNNARLLLKSSPFHGGIFEFGGAGGGDSTSAPAPVSTPTVDGTTNTGAENGGSQNSDPGAFSETNTHVAGVDEADFLKYDGQHIYVVKESNAWFDPNMAASPAMLRILETDTANATASPVGEVAIESDYWGELGELYLAQEEGDSGAKFVATIQSHWSQWIEPFPLLPGIGASSIAIGTDDAGMEPATTDVAHPFFGGADTRLTIFNVENKAMPAEAWKATIQGSVTDSRKIGNIMYLVMSYNPNWWQWLSYPRSEEEAIANEEAIKNLKAEDVLPTITVNDGEPELLVPADQCLVQSAEDQTRGFGQVTSLVAIDLTSQTIVSSKCLNTQVSGVYSSADTLVLGSSTHSWLEDSMTVLHKFSIDQGQIEYVSTGSTKGALGWQDPAFRMDVHNQFLRIVTTTRDIAGIPTHHLTIFADSDDSKEMSVVAGLPSEAEPADIGKPGEEIFAVRFEEDRAFIVTFRRIDPLYVLDLSEPTQPKIAGELEVPGFSNYLHPINARYVLGLGEEARDNMFLPGKLKMTLFDVSDPSMPKEHMTFVPDAEQSYSIANSDLRAMSFLKVSDQTWRVAFPMQTSNGDEPQTGLHLFELQGLDGADAAIAPAGAMLVEENDWWSARQDRGVLHDEAVFYSRAGSIYSAFWSSPDAMMGPQ